MLREEFLAQVTTPMLLPYEEQVAGRFESIRRNDWGSFYISQHLGLDFRPPWAQAAAA
ncbi:hypothetical protein ACN22W_33145 [Burkholderia theae]|uniref:hypothetical protein n=1 Tax=Burkholderia theae TaxID=3143496 RepID=UPI003AFA81B2